MICTCANHSHSSGRLTLNTAFQADPTRTLTLRNQFANELVQRFKRLKQLIKESIVQNDCFGLTLKLATGPTVFVATPVPYQAFAFERDPAKVQKFMDWLRQKMDEGVLEVLEGQQLGTAVESAWTNKYITTAYQKGMIRGRQELINANYDAVPSYGYDGASIMTSFNRPFHIDKVGLIYTRAYEGLKGITAEMSKQISGILAQGIADGKGPLALAKQINDRVDKIGITRAKILARTEIIRAHHVAMVQEYRNWGVEGVVVLAEWRTAGDKRVCPICKSLQKKVFTLDQIESMIPRHPQCRCIALPLDVTPEREAAPAKKKGGRPKGSKNKPKVVPVEVIPEPVVPAVPLPNITDWHKKVFELAKVDNERYWAYKNVNTESFIRNYNSARVKLPENLKEKLPVLSKEDWPKLQKHFADSTTLQMNRVLTEDSASYNDLMKNGVFKNQFELRDKATSGGANDPTVGGVRDRWEEKMTDGILQKDARYKKLVGGRSTYFDTGTAQDRPLYGYVRENMQGDGRLNGQYGEITFILKDEVKARTTMTPSNSSNFYSRRSLKEDPSDYAHRNSVLFSTENPDKALDTFFTSLNRLIKDTDADDMVFGSERTKFGSIEGKFEKIGKVLKTEEPFFNFTMNESSYTEAQFYGGIRLDRDVLKIVSDNYEKHIAKLAEKWNIPYKTTSSNPFLFKKTP